MPEKKNEIDEFVSITVPAVGGTEATEATDLVESLAEKYGISTRDTDALFNAMVAVYIRGRMVYGDRSPAMCSFGACVTGDDGSN